VAVAGSSACVGVVFSEGGASSRVYYSDKIDPVPTVLTLEQYLEHHVRFLGYPHWYALFIAALGMPGFKRWRADRLRAGEHPWSPS